MRSQVCPSPTSQATRRPAAEATVIAVPRVAPWHRGVLPARRRGAARGRSCARARANRLPRGLPRREGASAARLAVRHPKAPARTVPGAERRTGKPERCSVWELARGAPGPPTHEPTTGKRRPVAASPKARGAPRSPKGSRTGAERRGARGPKEHGHAGERAFTPPKRRATDPDTGGFERGHPPSAPTMPRGSRSGEPAQGGGKAAARGAGPDSPVDHDALRWRVAALLIAQRPPVRSDGTEAPSRRGPARQAAARRRRPRPPPEGDDHGNVRERSRIRSEGRAFPPSRDDAHSGTLSLASFPFSASRHRRATW